MRFNTLTTSNTRTINLYLNPSAYAIPIVRALSRNFTMRHGVRVCSLNSSGRNLFRNETRRKCLHGRKLAGVEFIMFREFQIFGQNWLMCPYLVYGFQGFNTNFTRCGAKKKTSYVHAQYLYFGIFEIQLPGVKAKQKRHMFLPSICILYEFEGFFAEFAGFF